MRHKKDKELSKIEQRVFDIATSYKLLGDKLDSYRLIHQYWLFHVSGNYSNFLDDFIGGKIKIETITRAFRRVKEVYPEFKYKESIKKEKIFKEHFRADNNLLQRELF